MDIGDNAHWLLELKTGWDDEDAEPIMIETFQRMLMVTSTILTSLESTIGYIMSQIPDPAIGPVADGSIDVYWSLPNKTLLLNFPQNLLELPSFYGRKEGTDAFIKGNLWYGDEEVLVLWLLR